ncbi:CPBP family intramembrane metalloprotease [bacterium]|nr:CPBP family intramembrane metalloprotease [bacterium]
MIDPMKIMLEVVLLAAALLQFRHAAGSHGRGFVIGFTATTLVLNLAFYYFAAWPLYVSFGQSSGLDRSSLHAMVLFDVVKWGVFAYVFGRLAAGLGNAGLGGGFALLRSDPRLSRILGIGIAGATLAIGAAYGLGLAENRLGYLEALPWTWFKDDPVYFKLGIWGGLRNLAGEEILARLGAQSVLFYALRRTAWAPFLAIVLSSVYFELWHNGFRELYFLNFAASCGFGWAYHKGGYESAAIAHCLADWLLIVILPRLPF